MGDDWVEVKTIEVRLEDEVNSMMLPKGHWSHRDEMTKAKQLNRMFLVCLE